MLDYDDYYEEDYDEYYEDEYDEEYYEDEYDDKTYEFCDDYDNFAWPNFNKGKILPKIKMDKPCFYYENIMADYVKAKAKKLFFCSKVQYENPNGMSGF